MSLPWTTSGSIVGGAAAAIGASACCAAPLLLVGLGIGGAWGSRVVALEAFQPWFVGAALLCFGYAFFKLYRPAEACAPGEACATPAARQRQRAIFWFVAILGAALMSFPLYGPIFY